mmetsp:Transcript_20254/g.57917  ORF Transcript_20254/g.57917 Transcript_20254/m.57917 type:complete len:216 (-) Transcript_20254:666-1313(-)
MSCPQSWPLRSLFPSKALLPKPADHPPSLGRGTFMGMSRQRSSSAPSGVPRLTCESLMEPLPGSDEPDRQAARGSGAEGAEEPPQGRRPPVRASRPGGGGGDEAPAAVADWGAAAARPGAAAPVGGAGKAASSKSSSPVARRPLPAPPAGEAVPRWPLLGWPAALDPQANPPRLAAPDGCASAAAAAAIWLNAANSDESNAEADAGIGGMPPSPR